MEDFPEGLELPSLDASECGKLLIHCCCGPCSMYPFKLLISAGITPDCFWFNPNIHPKFEWDRRLSNLQKACDSFEFRLIKGDDRCEEEYWRSKAYLEQFKSRCEMCYDTRMEAVAKYCADNGYDSFCTTLLVSPYQQHDRIARISAEKADKYGVKFFYVDFRPGFRYGQRLAKEIDLYRQKYCGCCFSLDESEFKDKIIRSFEA